MTKATKSLSIEQIMNSIEPLRTISNETLPIKVAITLTRTIKEIDEVLGVFNDSKQKLFEKYGEESENDSMKIKDDNLEEFNEAYVDLIKQKIDVNVQSVDVGELGDISVKPSSLVVLDWLINV